MASQGGFGAKLKVQVVSTLTLVPGVRDVVFPTQEKIVAEITGHDATSGYAIWIGTGKRRLGAFTAKINWDDTQTTHQAILANIAAETAFSVSVEDPDADEVIAFDAHAKMVGRVSPQEDGFTAEVQFQPSGAPTIT